jgi:prolyl oligopeptidase
VTELVAGQQVADPYRSLESDTAETRAWLQAQTEHTERSLAAWRDPKAEERLKRLLEIGTLGEVAIVSGAKTGEAARSRRIFFMLREAPRERPALYLYDLAAPPNAAELRSAPPLVDPQSFGERAAIDYMVPSPSGRFVAFGVSENGDERATLHVYDVEQRRLLPEAIAHAKWSSLEWWNDDKGFFYTRYPKPGEERWNEREPDGYDSYLFAHRLGQPDTSDPLVFKGDRPIDFVSVSLDESDRYALIANTRSWTANDLWLWDRGAQPAQRQLAPNKAKLVTLAQGSDHRTQGVVQQGQLYLVTNEDAPKQRIVKVDLAHAADKGRWTTVVPESDAAIEGTAFTQHFIVVHRLRDVYSRLELYTLDGNLLGEIGLPGIGSVSELSGSKDHDGIAFVWSSLLHPPSLMHCDLSTRKPELLYQVQSDFASSDYELQQAAASSDDGTKINVFYAQRRGQKPDGQTPVLLSGYGGFDVSILPSFSRNALYFLERGGIYALANLRGGGEFGETWHRAGMLQNKPKVFEDFAAVIRWFSSSGISNPKKIAITGGSNGGLLMGAMLTRVPTTFAAATSYVGLYDMIRYDKFPPAALWTTEYGDPNDPELARVLLGYSPYHNVHDAVSFPATLIETADHDTRVFWGHSAKFAARMQTANAGPNPVLFYVERAVGHGRGIGIADLVRRYARQYAFLQHALGMPL